VIMPVAVFGGMIGPMVMPVTGVVSQSDW
jgi:hypothetical protein